MKRIVFLIACLIALVMVGAVLAQTLPESDFTPIRQIGRLRPQGIQYDPNFDRFVWVDLAGQLLLVDAGSYQTQHILYESGAYNAYKFSHDGRYLALAIDRRIELWDTQTGEMSANYEPEGALLVTGPLHFADDDRLLLFDSVVPAPAATRRSENDTSIIPWLWDLPGARREAPPTLPNNARSYAFFNYRNGLVLGPNDKLIAGLPSRYLVIDGRRLSTPFINEILASRFERDPIDVWRSLRDEYLYVRPTNQSNLVQVKTADGGLYDIPLGRERSYSNLPGVRDLDLSNLARVIGDGNTQNENAFLRFLFGDGYRANFNYDPVSVLLLDILQPLTVSPDQMGFLIYTFNERTSRGVLEFVRPPDVSQMVLHPDNRHLMVRRAFDLQQIEIYDLDTGILEKTLYPAQYDVTGRQVLAYNATGDVIISDFQRFDARTGEVLLEDVHYTEGFSQVFFTEDSRKIVTLNDSDWRLWDIETGAIIRRETLRLRGELLQTWPDAHRFLTRFEDTHTVVMEVVELGMEERHTLHIPVRNGIETIIPSKDWQHFLVVYLPDERSQHYPGNEISVYNLRGSELFVIAGDDLPQPENRSYDWVDNDTILVSSSNSTSASQPVRIYDVSYHASGLPQCLVDAFPDDWAQWLPLWEQLNYRLRSDQLARLTQRLCKGLPSSPEDVPGALTPTPRYNYAANATRVPFSIVGVPVCLTSRFQREALDYAELWRQMSTNLTREEAGELEVMLCEGLISSLGGVQPTPTVDPNTLGGPTATPLPDAPQTSEFAENVVYEVMHINIHTQERFVGNYFPERETTSRNLPLVLSVFERRMRYRPANPLLSPDGTLLAAADGDGFITIFRLSSPYAALVATATQIAQESRVDAPRSLGLLPTATQPFDYAGQPGPTLTPTITPTPPPRAEMLIEQSQYEQVEAFCPAETLYDISAPPPGYSATGRLLVPPSEGAVYNSWALEPEDGRLYLDESLPGCDIHTQCDYSFDRDWIFIWSNNLAVAKADGSSATILFAEEEQLVWPESIYWTDQNRLQYIYRDYVRDNQNRLVQTMLLREYDPVTGAYSESALMPASPVVNNLPTTLVASASGGRRALVSTPYRGGAVSGEKYYLYDREAETAQYFARVDGGSLIYEWHPLGAALYYRYPDSNVWYVLDAETGEQRILGRLPGGQWSRDGRYRVQWFSQTFTQEEAAWNDHQRLPKISIWDRETGLTRRYCIPETGRQRYDGLFTWSPDNRYVTFTIYLPPEGDNFPLPGALPPTATPVPLETQYQLRTPRTLVLDIQTGSVTVLHAEVSNVLAWVDDAKEGE